MVFSLSAMWLNRTIGKVAERLKAQVSKTCRALVALVGSNPTLSAVRYWSIPDR